MDIFMGTSDYGLKQFGFLNYDGWIYGYQFNYNIL